MKLPGYFKAGITLPIDYLNFLGKSFTNYRLLKIKNYLTQSLKNLSKFAQVLSHKTSSVKPDYLYVWFYTDFESSTTDLLLELHICMPYYKHCLTIFAPAANSKRTFGKFCFA